jgi:hypothetical protein
MIERLTNLPDNVLGFVCRGQVTKADYDTVLVPAVNAALTRHDRLRLYYELGSEFTGIDPGAMWEDFKVGMEHLTRWERAAVVTDVEWIRFTMRMFSFMMPGTTRMFSVAEAEEARSWILADT